ncbi:MAG: hypothetical protein K5656_04100 [Lachnospiraceae bacterium]|nr:hypothetical protein [Lachnospiraceae bacterium]
MNCRKASSLIYTYLNHQQLGDDLIPFIKHIQNCPDCHEEMEISYIMIEGMRRLESGGNIAVNFQKEMDDELKGQLGKQKLKFRTKVQMILIGLAISLFGIVLGFFEQEFHNEYLDKQLIADRGNYYYYISTRNYVYDAGDYTPPAIRRVINYDE